MKRFSALLIALICFSELSAQLAISRIFGKNATRSKLGFEVFAFYEFHLDDRETRSIRLELLDFAYYPGKESTDIDKGYVSVKIGYKYIFSESKTGFYVLPAAGYARVIFVDPALPEATHGDGIAIALESGYSLEVGERGNTFNFGLKGEMDRAGGIHAINSISLRVSYSFGMFNKRRY